MQFISKIKATILVLLRPVTRFLWPAPTSHLYPVSRRWGFERGTPIGRFYVDRFIKKHAGDIQGDILEIKSRRYTDLYARGTGKRDVLDIDSSNPNATIIADLEHADNVPDESYDCFIVTETLQFVFGLREAAAHIHRILKPGGVLIVSVPSIAPVDNELASWDCWRFSPCACQKLFWPVFGKDNVEIEVYGNFSTCISGLSGVAFEELPVEVINQVDSKYAQGILVRAKKSATPQSHSAASQSNAQVEVR
jgi:SAM-dependent methyltransferase